MKRVLLCTALFMLSGLTGCAHREPTPTISDAQTYQKELKQITRWQFEGKIGVRRTKQSDTASVHWKQDKDTFDIFLTGPLGAGATRLTGTSTQWQFEHADKKLTGTDRVEDLLGYTLPVEISPQWLLGYSDNPQARFNINHTLAGFSENSWQASYISYQTVGPWLLPEKIILKRNDFKHEDMQVTIVIKQWTLD